MTGLNKYNGAGRIRPDLFDDPSLEDLLLPRGERPSSDTAESSREDSDNTRTDRPERTNSGERKFTW